MFESFKKSGKISKDLTIDEWKEKDLSNCILSGDPECAFVEGTKNDLPVAYLCGQDDYCKIVEDRRALRQAIWKFLCISNTETKRLVLNLSY